MDEMNYGNNKCFMSALTRLRESSKDAVVSADFSDAYTMYMHVNRPVQDEFVSIIEKTYNSNNAELILLCGSVGDGKSHLLSYCKAKYPEMMSKFYIHNDSTASLYIDKPASFTLVEVMKDFTDERLAYSSQKVILAINLGTLNNFLEQDKDSRFLKLKEYVDKAGILDQRECKDNEDECFHCVNFADYHLYELTSEGAKSEYVSGIIAKITQNNPDNIFYKEYCSCCKNCDAYKRCPVRVNYELLSDVKVQSGVISSLIEAIVKNKLIVSTRSLFNFIYEILVDERHFDRGSLEPRKEPDKMNSIEYCNSLLPNTLFGRSGASEILEAMSTVDPMRIRNEAIDDFFVFYENSVNIVDIFLEDLDEYESLIERLKKTKFSEIANHSIKEAILKLFVRLCWLTNKRQDLLADDQDYIEFMAALYFWNKGEFKSLKNIYNIVEQGTLAWNGPVAKNEMQIPIGNKKTDYHLIQEIQIKPTFDKLPVVNKNVLFSFQDELKLKYRYNDDVAEIEIDFALYSLLKKVVGGYIPSANDKRVNVKCVEFVKKISNGGKKGDFLIIRNLTQRDVIEYRLEYDEAFGYSFEVK